jgi:3-phosphoinositide dependent protein kinase-1
VGTAEYVSPEVLNNAGISYTADLWALGCIVYQMLTGRPPFKGASEYLTFQLITSRTLSFPEGFPEVARDLAERLLQLEPSERLGRLCWIVCRALLQALHLAAC